MTANLYNIDLFLSRVIDLKSIFLYHLIMSIPSGKKTLLIGFIIVLLIAIPSVIYLVSQQQKTTKSSVPATSLSFTPGSQSVELGASTTFDINIDPGTNSVSFVKLLISYDATKLAIDGAGFVPNPGVFSSVIQEPVYGPGTISVTLSIGANAPPVTKPSKLGTLTLKSIAPTETVGTQLTFGNQTQVLSVGATDQFNENVLSTSSPATVNITQAVASPTPILILTPTPTLQVSRSATPSSKGVSLATPAGAAEAPICSSFTTDRALIGVVPFNVNFTMIGTSSADILKATFNFGDGQVKELTKADGIGATSLNSLTSHVYHTAGTFSAFGTITDVNGAVSQVGTCTLILTLNSSSATESAAQVTPVVSPLPPTGPSNIVTIGVIGLFIVIVGTILLLAL